MANEDTIRSAVLLAALGYPEYLERIASPPILTKKEKFMVLYNDAKKDSMSNGALFIAARKLLLSSDSAK